MPAMPTTPVGAADPVANMGNLEEFAYAPNETMEVKDNIKQYAEECWRKVEWTRGKKTVTSDLAIFINGLPTEMKDRCGENEDLNALVPFDFTILNNEVEDFNVSLAQHIRTVVKYMVTQTAVVRAQNHILTTHKVTHMGKIDGTVAVAYKMLKKVTDP